jgi:hypothetical protein
MRTWLRLTSLFGPPDDMAESGNIICASIGSILRADGEDIVRGSMPGQLTKLLRQIAATELEQLAVSRCGVTVSDAVGLIVDVAAPFGVPPDHGGSPPVTQRI